MSKRLDLTEQRFGRLTCVKYLGSNEKGHALWLCRCNCGRKITALGSQIKNGNTKSCGCWKSEVTIKRNTTHGLTLNKSGKKECGDA
jgi:hypothetical protein